MTDHMLKVMYDKEHEYQKRQVERVELEKNIQLALDIIDDLINDKKEAESEIEEGRRIGLITAKKILESTMRRVYND
ncbi:MAG: hypothetical protein ACOCRO_07375 [Halanaerobiales bacterium]